MSDLANTEMEFVDFTKLLLSETTQAVIDSLVSQEERLAWFASQAHEPAERFASQISDAEVESYVALLFPSESGRGSAVDEGCPYAAESETTSESPPIRAAIGYEMVSTRADPDHKNGIITRGGSARIREHTRTRLAEDRQATMRELLGRGMPRVLVDSGRVSSKLTMRIEAASEQQTKPGFLGRLLKVRPLNTVGAENLTMRTDITSEIEITFKTVVS